MINVANEPQPYPEINNVAENNSICYLESRFVHFVQISRLLKNPSDQDTMRLVENTFLKLNCCKLQGKYGGGGSTSIVYKKKLFSMTTVKCILDNTSKNVNMIKADHIYNHAFAAKV